MEGTLQGELYAVSILLDTLFVLTVLDFTLFYLSAFILFTRYVHTDFLLIECVISISCDLILCRVLCFFFADCICCLAMLFSSYLFLHSIMIQVFNFFSFFFVFIFIFSLMIFLSGRLLIHARI